MKTNLAKQLISLRESTGLSTKDFAEAIGMPATSYQYYEGGYKKNYLPDAVVTKLMDNAEALSLDIYDIQLMWRAPAIDPSNYGAPYSPPSRDLPILGKVMGGVGMFFDNGSKLGETMRPSTLGGVNDAYAVYIDGTSMEPRYFAGEIALIHPHKSIKRADFVVVQYDNDHRERCYTIKRYIKHNGDMLHLEQLNPPAPWEIPLDKVHHIHRVVGAIDS